MIMGLLSNLFGLKEPVNCSQLIKDGVPVVDVRTKKEFKSGHFKKSINLPLQDISSWCSKFNDGDAVILVCKSGTRASLAKRKLKKRGVVAYNAMAWENLK